MNRLIMISVLLSGAMLNVSAMQLSQKEQQEWKLQEILRDIKEGRSYHYDYSDLADIAPKIKNEALRKIATVAQQQLDASDEAVDEALGLLFILEKGEAINYGVSQDKKGPLEAIKAQKEARRKALAGPTAEELATKRRIEESRLADERLMQQQKEQIIEEYKKNQNSGLLRSFGNSRLQGLALRFKEGILRKAAQASTDSSLDELDESLALIELLIHGDEKNSGDYLMLESSLRAIRAKKAALLKAAAGPSAEEIERARIAEEGRLAEELRRLERYNVIKNRITETWRHGLQERELITGVVRGALAVGGRLDENLRRDFLDWLQFEAFSRAQEIIDVPHAFTIEQITDAQALVAAFYGAAHPDDVKATSVYSILEQLKSQKEKVIREAAEEAFRQSPEEVARRQRLIDERLAEQERRLAQLQTEFLRAYKANRSLEHLENYSFSELVDLAQFIKDTVLKKAEAIEAQPDAASLNDIEELLAYLPLMQRGDEDRFSIYTLLESRLKEFKARKERSK